MATTRVLKLSAVAASVCGSLLGYDYYERASRQRNFFISSFVGANFPTLEIASCEQARTSDPGNLKLKQVQVVFRHGARTPMSEIKQLTEEAWDVNVIMKDLQHKHINYALKMMDGTDAGETNVEKYFPRKILKGGSTAGCLTALGQDEMFNLGKRLKAEYVDQYGLISSDFRIEDVYVRTTNIERTIFSAICLLAGMYEKQSITGPIPIFTNTLETETMYPNYYFCNKLKPWVKVAFFEAESCPGLQEKAAAVRKIEGLEDCTSPIEFVLLRDLVAARMAHNIPVPQHILNTYDVLDQAAVQVQVGVISGNKEQSVLRLSIGSFLEQICAEMEKMMKNESGYKMCLYSSHDTAVMSILMALNVFDGKWPRFSATVRIEMFTNEEKKWFVRVIYDDKEMILPECSSPFCPWERFQELMAPYRITDWSKECENDKEDPDENKD